MRYFLVLVLGLAFASVSFADEVNPSQPNSIQPRIPYECWLKKPGKKGGKCQVEGLICVAAPAGTTVATFEPCREGATIEVECTDGFELEDKNAPVFVRIPFIPDSIIYGQERDKESYLHITQVQTTSNGPEFRARLVNIVDDSEVDHYVGVCKAEIPN